MGGRGSHRAGAADRQLLGVHVRAALAASCFDALLSPAAIDDICRSQAALLPPEITSRFGFECRLGEEKPACDFLVRTCTHQEEWSALAHYAAGLHSPPWIGVRSLLGERVPPASPQTRDLKNLWLEYDYAAPQDQASVPSVFFGTDALTSCAATETAADAIGTLRGSPLPQAVRRKLQCLVDALPKHAKVFQAGVMCSRPDSSLRLCVLGPEFVPGLTAPAGGETKFIRAFLEAVRWPGDVSSVTELLRAFASSIDHVALDFDMREDGSLAAKIGIEIYQDPAHTSASRVVALVTRLVSGGLCTPEKAEGLLAWDGVTHERLHSELWPRAMVAARIIRGGAQYSTFCRWLHHVKLVYEPSKPLIAKAYLAVSHAFLTDARIREALNKASAGLRPFSRSLRADTGLTPSGI